MLRSFSLILGLSMAAAVCACSGSPATSLTGPQPSTTTRNDPNTVDTADPATDDTVQENPDDTTVVDPATPIDVDDDPATPPIEQVIADTVSANYEFTMQKPEGSRMLTNGLVEGCPASWTAACPPHFEFSFEGRVNGTNTDLHVSIDRVDTGNLPASSNPLVVGPDGKVSGKPLFIHEVAAPAADAGVPANSTWSTVAARAESANHQFFFQMDCESVLEVDDDAFFASVMRTFVITNRKSAAVQ